MFDRHHIQLKKFFVIYYEYLKQKEAICKMPFHEYKEGMP